MSGICAVCAKQAVPTLELVRPMCNALALHASERREWVTAPGIGLGVSSRFESQQIYSDRGLIVVCDTHIFNETELQNLVGPSREEHATTARLLAALYGRFGSAFLDKVRGEFSLILWDGLQKKLLAATDAFCTRPLVYYEDRNLLLVASRIDALVASGEVSREINPRAIANYLNYTVTLAPETILSKVTRVTPGTFLESNERGTRSNQYWDMRYEPDGHAEERLSLQLEALVEEAVRMRCQNVPSSELGAFLSGGTDSSTVVGMMRRCGCDPVKSFSIGFEEQRFNELEYARITARTFNADHHEYLVSAKECLEALPEIVRFFDEPFGNSSAIPTYFCARLAAQHGTKTLLAGDGGDELFGGNERYRTDKIFDLYQKMPKLVRTGLMEPALRLIPLRNGLVGMTRSYIRRSNLRQPERFFSYDLLLETPPSSIFEDGFMASLGEYSVLEVPSRYYWHGPAKDPLDRLLYVDVKMTLGDNDLRKVTQMCELAGVQARYPFLDRSVGEFSGCIPATLKVKGFKKRYLFKRAFRKLLPIQVLNKTKHGFGIPVAVWMKSDRRTREFTHDVLQSPRAQQRGFIKRSFVEDLFRKYEADETTFYGDILWTFLTLELWFRQFVDEPRAVGV